MVPPHKVGGARLPGEDTRSTALKHLPIFLQSVAAVLILPGLGLPLMLNVGKSLSSYRLNKQRLINWLEAKVNERHLCH